MRRTWLAQGLAQGLDVEAAANMLGMDGDATTSASAAIAAQVEADAAREVLAEENPETYAVERDQRNDPVAKRRPMTRRQRRHFEALERRAHRRADALARKLRAE